MNSLLLKYKDPSEHKDEFKERWENSYVLLEPLFMAIQEMAGQPTISPSDFELPSFREKLIWDQARFDLMKKILILFPSKLLDK